MRVNQDPLTSAVRPCSVLIVEDHTLVRDLLSTYVVSVAGFSLLGSVSGIEDALAITAEKQPNLVILDWMLADGFGRDYLRRLPSIAKTSASTSKPKVLVVSASTSEATVRDAISLGAVGFIEKTASFSEFRQSLQSVSIGVPHFGPLVAKALQRIVRDPERFQGKVEITPRECDILRYIAQGLSSKEIAATLGLSIRTVENHRASIFRRTGLRSIAQLTLMAVRMGLVDSGPANSD